MMELRKQWEKEFHDRLRKDSFGQRWSKEEDEEYSSDPLWSNMKYYSIERSSRQFVEEWLRRHSPNKRVLDYACGNGEDALFVAKLGAEVVGIDISEVSIENCTRRAVEGKVDERVSFCVMDAEALEFADGSFDIIIVYGVLHHLNLQKALSELARVLKPNGTIICTEALKHNPAIHLYRRMTPHLRTEWEVNHVLGRKDFELMRKYFTNIEIHFYHLTSLAAVPLRKSPMFYPALGMLEVVDKVLLRLPLIQWLAWQAVFLLSEPNKTAS